MKNKPKKGRIRSQKEADEVKAWLVKTTIETFNIDKGEAEKRVDRLLKSDALNRMKNSGVDDSDPRFQMVVDIYIKTPSTQLINL